jgi:hypothetical protein
MTTTEKPYTPIDPMVTVTNDVGAIAAMRRSVFEEHYQSFGWWITEKTPVQRHRVNIDSREIYFMGEGTGNYNNRAVCTCGWNSQQTTSSTIVNTWAAEHEVCS